MDKEENKYIYNDQDDNYQQSIENEAVRNFLNSISNEPGQPLFVELTYLSGYEGDIPGQSGGSIMGAPIWSPVSNITEEFIGRQLLIKAEPIENNVTLPIYNQYFVKEV